MRNQSNQYQSNFWPNFQSSAFHKGKPQNQLSCLVIGGRQVFPSLCQSQYTDKKVWNFSTPLQLAGCCKYIFYHFLSSGNHWWTKGESYSSSVFSTLLSDWQFSVGNLTTDQWMWKIDIKILILKGKFPSFW